MNPREQGFLLLTSHLGDASRKVLTVAQMRVLTGCVRASQSIHEDRPIVPEDLMAMGYNRPSAERIVSLLSEGERMMAYAQRGIRMGCIPITRISDGYPQLLHKRLSLDTPGVLWAKGDVTLLNQPAVALVGSRDLRAENAAFAREVGIQAAKQGYVLISGNARGADREAQDACLAAGGRVISIVADSLEKQTLRQNVLYLSEDSYDLSFSTLRALSRNRLIHCMGQLTVVAQCRLERGGSWDGAVNNLRAHWSPLCCFSDGSEAAKALEDRGATPVTMQQLGNLQQLREQGLNFFDLT